MNPLAAIDRYWYAPAPAERLASLRVLTGAFAVVYLLAAVRVLTGFDRFAAERFEPVGLAVMLDGPLPEAGVWLLWAISLATGLAFTLGYRFRFSGPAFALLFVWVTSYRNSWGMVFHTENLTALHLTVLAVSASAATLSLDHRRAPTVVADAGAYGWPIRLLCVVTVIVYVIAGLAKLRNSGLEWLEGDILRNYIAYDAVRKAELGSMYSPLGALMVQYAWPFPILGALTMLLELGAPLAMLHRRLGHAWVFGVYGFHVGVLLTMAIAFPYPLSGVAFAPFFRAEGLWRLKPLKRLRSRLLDPPVADS